MREILEETQNRELSWLRFNQRVLEEARDETVPLMERMKFVAIFTSNLDEFFMIRVGSLYDMASADSKKIDQRSGMTAKQQLDAIYRAVSPLYKERDKTYAEIKKQLSPYGVCGLDFKELEQQEKKFVKKYFKEEVMPVLSPQIVDANHPFPHLLSKELYVVANLKQGDKTMLGIIPVPQYISNILYLPGYDIRYIRMEKIILEFIDLVFDQYQISDKNYIRVTRNADVSPDDEAYANSYFINANSIIAPGIVDADRQPILTHSEVYSCIYGRASITFYAFNTKTSRGIACGLQNVQKLRDGDPLGGHSSAEEDFADDEDFLN